VVAVIVEAVLMAVALTVLVTRGQNTTTEFSAISQEIHGGI
jgi:hypothetical protein